MSRVIYSLYIDIPEVIKEEKETAKEYTNQPVPGDITFTGGLIDDIWQSSGINYTPTTGDAIFFPGAMRHAVYPFKSDVERVTFPEPLNATAEAVTSPEIEKFLFEANVVDVEELPVKAPTNVVEVKTPELEMFISEPEIE